MHYKFQSNIEIKKQIKVISHFNIADIPKT